MKRWSYVAFLFSVGGCYTYVPIETAVPESGSEIRAHLSPVQDFDVGDLTVHDVARVDGIVYGSTPDSVAVWSNWLYSEYGTRFHSRRQVYYLPRHQVRTLEERRLHPIRSLIGAGVGLGVFASVFTFVADIGGGPSGKGVTPIEFRISQPRR